MRKGLNSPIKNQSLVKFNFLKHHRNHILKFLNTTEYPLLDEMLNNLCNNYIDIYTGALTPTDITQEILNYLKSINKLDECSFSTWLSESNNYRHIKLHDNSEWIIRKSKSPESYIHIHPAKYSAFTIRFKGSTLKTTYKLKHLLKNSTTAINLEIVNKVRQSISLSPIKRLEKGKGILKCWEIFFSHEI